MKNNENIHTSGFVGMKIFTNQIMMCTISSFFRGKEKKTIEIHKQGAWQIRALYELGIERVLHGFEDSNRVQQQMYSLWVNMRGEG